MENLKRLEVKMQIRIKVDEFLEVLNKIKHIAKPEKVYPVLSNGVFETINDKVQITAASLNNKVIIDVPAEIIEPGKCLIDIAKLTAILGTLSGNALIEEKDSVIWIKKDNTKCKLEKTDLSAYPEDLFRFGDADITINISVKDLFEALKKSENFSDHNSSRILNGININISESIAKFAATDGNKLAYIIKCTSSPDVNTNIIIPAFSVNSLLQLLPSEGDAAILLSRDICKFEFENIKFYTRLIEGQFPKVEQLIPKESTTEFSVNKTELKNALDRIGVVEVKDDKCVVMFTVKGSLMTVEAKDYKSNDVLALEEKSGEDISFKLNRYFLMTVLNALSGNFVKFKLTTPRAAILFPDKENKFMIMPMT